MNLRYKRETLRSERKIRWLTANPRHPDLIACAANRNGVLSNFTVFNVGGEGYRVVAAIHFNRQKFYIRHVFTHAECERWSDRLRRGK